MPLNCYLMLVQLTREFYNKVLTWPKVLEIGLVDQTSNEILPVMKSGAPQEAVLTVPLQ